MLISGRGKLYASPGEGTIANRDTSQDLFVPLGGRLGEVPEQRFGLVHGVAEAGARLRLPLLAGLVEVVSHAAAAHPELSELEVNPLLVLPSGAVALDARFVTRPTDQESE